ncbi:hypothetical protein ABT127_29945 [Streptomyces sp. NPDC001904]|uniref:hypothetical protein n=1 Tax=Streptomyces sp. NPDC001904 TaxID=3154531 RepID=UPI003319DC1F
MFFTGRRRDAHRQLPTPNAQSTTGPVRDEAQHGTGWQTPDDDPEQGHPHR